MGPKTQNDSLLQNVSNDSDSILIISKIISPDTTTLSGILVEIIRALGTQMQEVDSDGTGFTAEMGLTAVLHS
jgi:hypothetical protein